MIMPDDHPRSDPASPVAEFVQMARNPVPSGPIVGTFAGHDGLPLRFARWDATRGPRRGTACVFTGRAETLEKYFETIADLRRRGYAVAIHDWRGQGGSARELPDPRMGHVRRFEDYDADLIRFMKDVVLPDSPPPYIALAHSMGGNILLRNSIVAGSWFDRMVLSAPMIAFNDAKIGYPQGLARAYAELLGIGPLGRRYVLGGGPEPLEAKGFEDNILTSDAERFQRNRQLLEHAPHLALGSPTVAWLRAAYRSIALLTDPEFASRVRIPLLLVAAGDDRIVSSLAIEQFASRLKIGARVVIAGSRHEVLQERDEIRQRFWAAFDAYLGVGTAAA
jgi:lysophospholipase